MISKIPKVLYKNKIAGVLDDIRYNYGKLFFFFFYIIPKDPENTSNATPQKNQSIFERFSFKFFSF